MKILIYASRHQGASQRLLDSVRNLSDSHPCDCDHYDELPLLIDALHRSRMGSRMAVLFPSDPNELARLVTLKHLLFDLPIILILPNGTSQTLSHGHALRPRFISYADSDFSDVAAVADKLVERLTVIPMANA
jgi:hypothetical protein